MGTVIYSASPVQTFFGTAGTILFLLALGILGVAYAVFQRNQRRWSRLFTGAAGAVLLIAGAVYGAVTLASVSSASQSVVLKLDQKQIAVDNCGDNGETCKRYVLEATTSTTAYDFDVPQAAYDNAQVDSCYQFTYYVNRGIFANNTASYQRIDKVERIETADPSACQ